MTAPLEVANASSAKPTPKAAQGEWVSGDAIVVAVGSSDAAARSDFTDCVATASRRSGKAARPAFLAGSGPLLADQLAPISPARGAPVVVIPWLLAPGRSLDSVHRITDVANASVRGTGLVFDPSFVDYAVHSLLMPSLLPGPN